VSVVSLSLLPGLTESFSSDIGRGLVALDEAIQTQPQGIYLVQVNDSSMLSFCLEHLSRRASNLRRFQTTLSLCPKQSLFREAGLSMGLDALPSDLEQASQIMCGALADRPVGLLGIISQESRWDVAVFKQMLVNWSQQIASKSLLVVLSDSPGWLQTAASLSDGQHSHLLGNQQNLNIQRFLVDETTLDAQARQRWWAAMASHALVLTQNVPLTEIHQQWSQTFSLVGLVEPSPVQASMPAHWVRLLTRLQVAGRPWPMMQLPRLDASVDIRALASCPMLDRYQDVVHVRSHAPLMDGSPDDLECVAKALPKVFPTDPWAFSRTSELLVQLGRHAEAERAHEQAIALADDTIARLDLWAVWQRLVETFPTTDQAPYFLRSARLALRCGDADGAFSWAQQALKCAGDDFETLLIFGEAALARGDLIAARSTFERALSQAKTDTEQASVFAAMAEMFYTEGELDRAEEFAHQACGSTNDKALHLQAQNTLGKLLLARGHWQQAERHFANDYCSAAWLNDHVAQLRARLNQAVAILSDGRVDEAQPMLESVLHEGELLGETRAIAFSLSNLAVLAINRHDYNEALQLCERAINIRRKLGERLGLARLITNLAELRLRLGLVEEAEQALAFGRIALSQGATSPRRAQFEMISARIHLCRQNTAVAMRDILMAIRDAIGSSNGDLLNECYRLAVRIALEDGDCQRAQEYLTQAQDSAQGSIADAEIALLEALLARSKGEACLEAAEHALALVLRTGDGELIQETHALITQIALAERNNVLFVEHLSRALALRDRVAAKLPEAVRNAYLKRADLQVLASLEAQRDQSEESPPSSAPSTARSFQLPDPPLYKLIGEHTSMRTLLTAINKVAPSSTTVLIHGESGTGKELVAESLHQASQRRHAPLVKVNCAALVESLLLSELFGHEKGAFTGATNRRRGRFELAEGGTLFLDEIGDISAKTQVALLRVLQERTFERVGGVSPIKADVRIICATHRDLRTMVETGEFRQDLYFRLTGIVLEVPPLRQRLSDLPVVARSLLESIAIERSEPVSQLGPDAISLLVRHSWPGNVRELDNVLRACSLFTESDTISARDICEHVKELRYLQSTTTVSLSSMPSMSEASQPHTPFPSDETTADLSEELMSPPSTVDLVYSQLRSQKHGLFDIKRQIERDCIARALAETNGNITRAATILGMKRPRLSQLVKQYGLSGVSSEGS
jgi:transcriptional regulator with GAF, ATPase, and Fis domain/Tfp pilus assembly protein PilF